jgi:hypothetical protein
LIEKSGSGRYNMANRTAIRTYRWKTMGINITGPFHFEKESSNTSASRASMSRFEPMATIEVKVTRTF